MGRTRVLISGRGYNCLVEESSVCRRHVHQDVANRTSVVRVTCPNDAYVERASSNHLCVSSESCVFLRVTALFFFEYTFESPVLPQIQQYQDSIVKWFGGRARGGCERFNLSCVPPPLVNSRLVMLAVILAFDVSALSTTVGGFVEFNSIRRSKSVILVQLTVDPSGARLLTAR